MSVLGEGDKGNRKRRGISSVVADTVFQPSFL